MNKAVFSTDIKSIQINNTTVKGSYWDDCIAWPPLINWCVFIVAENCSGYKTCGHCLDQPGCGWCTDPSNTGRGQCIEGSYRGPIQTLFHAPSSSGPSLIPAPQPMLNVSLCPLEGNYNWSFIQCPGKTYVTYVRSCFAKLLIVSRMSTVDHQNSVTRNVSLTLIYLKCI